MVNDLHDSLACCGYVHEPFRARGSAPSDDYPMAVLSKSEDGRAAFSGVTRCGSPWACPCCAPRIASARGQTVKGQLVPLMEVGWSAFSMTLTVRHKRMDDLSELWDVLSAAWGLATSGKRWAAVLKRGKPEYVRGYDVTYSERNGWHPHLHLTLLLPPSHVDGMAVARWLLARWVSSLAKQGWDAQPGAQHVAQVNDPAQAAAYACTPAACYESVALALKRARTGKDGMTPFELLEKAAYDRMAGVGASKWVARWRDYVKATKGRRQVTTSRGIHLKEDAEDLEPIQEMHVAEVGMTSMLELDRRRLAGPLLDAVEDAPDGHEHEAARAILLTLAARDWTMCRAQAPEPSPEPPGMPPGATPGAPPGPAYRNQRERDQAAAYRAWQAARPGA